MGARVLVNLALVLVAGLLGWLVYRQAMEEDAGTRVLALAPEQVQTIRIERPGAPVVVLAREGEGWRLREPKAVPASQFHVDILLRFLEMPVAGRHAAAAMDLSALGLATPRATVSYDDADFAFGDLEPLTGRRYVLRGEQVLLVTEGASTLAGGPWWNFIDRRLLPPDARVLAVETGGRRYSAREFPLLAARWQESEASIVKPMRPGVIGQPLTLELAGGEILRWQWLDDEQPRLLRPDQGLAYHLSADALAVLSGQRGE